MGEISVKKKGGGGLRLPENKEPRHHGVWILTQTWGLIGRASFGGPFLVQGTGCRMEKEICRLQRT